MGPIVWVDGYAGKPEILSDLGQYNRSFAGSVHWNIILKGEVRPIPFAVGLGQTKQSAQDLPATELDRYMRPRSAGCRTENSLPPPDPLLGFHPSFALNAQGGHGAGHQSPLRNFLLTFFTNPKGSLFNQFQGFFDFLN